jgi:hypothetical protein
MLMALRLGLQSESYQYNSAGSLMKPKHPLQRSKGLADTHAEEERRINAKIEIGRY